MSRRLRSLWVIMVIVGLAGTFVVSMQALGAPGEESPQLTFPAHLSVRWDGYLLARGQLGAEGTERLLMTRRQDILEAVSAYGERVVECAADSPSAEEVEWVGELVRLHGSERVAVERDAIMAWVVASHLGAEQRCHEAASTRVVVSEARYAAVMAAVSAQIRGFVDSLEPDARKSAAPGFAEFEALVSVVTARPGTELVLDDGVLLAGWEMSAEALPADTRAFLEAREVFRDPVDFIAHIAALDAAL